MFKRHSTHNQAVLKALFVTLLWSSSVVLIKWQVREIPALLFAGLRYTLAFLALLPFGLRSGELRELRGAGRDAWPSLLALGLVFYAFTMGTQFLSLAHLPAVTLNFILSLTPVIVALVAIPLLGERPSGRQWVGVAVVMLGVVLFFSPLSFGGLQVMGMAIAVFSLLANAGSTILGRHVNRLGRLSPLAVTIGSMGVGAFVLLAAGLALEGLPRLAWQSWAVVLWLALVNTALVFPLWNDSLRTLRAVESSVIQTSMAVQVPILAAIFLGERMSARELAGLALAVLGIVLVQLSRRLRPYRTP